MLDQEAPSDQKSLALLPAKEEVVLLEKDNDVLTLILPPKDDLQHIEEIRRNEPRASSYELANEYASRAVDTYREELERQAKKFADLGEQPTYLNRLANLALAVGDRELEEKYLRLAATLATDQFYAHKLGSNLVARDQSAAAEDIFSSLDLSRDVVANLCLAYLHVARREFDEAADCVKVALSINPIDYSARLFDGGLKLFRGDAERAIHSLRVAIESRPSSSVAHSNIGLAYSRLGEHEKALSSLRMAVSLNPMNVRAVLMLADIAHELGRDAEAIQSLKFLVEFDQKDPVFWGRLARAFMRTGRNDEALTALHHLASLKDDSETWNNLGVAHIYRGDKERAMRAFKHAIVKGVEAQDRGYFLAARNLSQLLTSLSRFKDLEILSRGVIGEDARGLTFSDGEISDIRAFHLHALRMMDDIEGFKREALISLAEASAASELKEWVLGILLTILTVQSSEPETAIELIDNYREWIDTVSKQRHPRDPVRRTMFLNNIGFVLAEVGRVDEAEKYLRGVSKEIHKNPFVTATMGLLDFRKGNIERAEARYEEAITLAKSRNEKRLIRQKLYLELGRYWGDIDVGRGVRNLQRAAQLGEGLQCLLSKLDMSLVGYPTMTLISDSDLSSLKLRGSGDNPWA